MFAGVLRFICTNSMIAGGRFEEVRIPHRGGIPDQIIEGVYPSNADHTNSGAHHQTASDSNLLTADCRRFHASSSQAILSGIFCAAIGGVRRS